MINHRNIIRRSRRPRSGVDASLTAAVRGLSRLVCCNQTWLGLTISPTLPAHADEVIE